MKRSMMALGFAATTAASVFAGSVSAQSMSDCLGRLGGPQTHTIMVVEAGFFPTVTYVCPDDVIMFVNGHTNWAHFNIDWGSSKQWSGWQSPGANYNGLTFTVADTMADVSFTDVNAHPYYPNGYAGYIEFGIAPRDLDDL